MQTKKSFFVLALFGALLLGSLSPLDAQAQQTASTGLQYQLLEQIPGFPSWSGFLPDYLQNLYKFTFWAIGIAALLMLSVGGFLYTTSAGNTSRIQTAKTIIFDSVLGICLALVAWLFLYVINPDFTTMKLPAVTITPTSTVAPVPTAPTPLPTTPPTQTPSPGTAEDLAQKVLSNPNINTSGAAPFCNNANGSVTPRTNLQEIVASGKMTACASGCNAGGFCAGATSINSQLLQVMLDVAKIMPFTINSIAGGSHSPSSRHYSGQAFDASPPTQALLDAFRSKGARNSFCDSGGVQVPCSAGSHIHVQF